MALAMVGDRKAIAQEKGTTSEDIAIAYFKTANIKPDFKKWAEGSEEFKIVAPTLVPEFIEKESQRLERKWADYRPDEFMLSIKTPVRIELKTTTDEKGQEKYWMHLTFERGYADYFPYAFQSHNFAIIPQKMEAMMVQGLQKPQFDLLFQEFNEIRSGNALLRMQLKPSKSYTDKPYEMDGVEQWVLLTDIATMTISSLKNEAQLWNYSAGWYVSPETEALRDLYKNGKSAQTAQ